MNPRSVYENYLRSITAKRDSPTTSSLCVRLREMARHATPYTIADMGNSFTKLLKGFTTPTHRRTQIYP